MVEIVCFLDGLWRVRLGLLFFGIVVFDFWESAVEVDCVLVLVVSKVMPGAVVKDDRVRFLSSRR